MQRVFREDYKKFLFNKHILVAAPSGSTSQYAAESRFAMAKYLNINIIRGGKMADMEMFHFASSMLGENVPKPFYQGFPDSVRKLSPSELYYDQILSYFRTYGMGDFSTTQHSVLESEEDIRRKAFKETGSIKDFEILTEEQAACHPMRNYITRAVGTDDVLDVDIYTEKREAGDRWLICSDGLYGLMTKAVLAELASIEDPEEAAEQLMQTALENGGRDNISLVLMMDDAGAKEEEDTPADDPSAETPAEEIPAEEGADE